MKGKLKNGPFRVGFGEGYGVAEKGKVVEITADEKHPIFGPRFKVLGRNEWFEKNCFEWVGFCDNCEQQKESTFSDNLGKFLCQDCWDEYGEACHNGMA